MAFFTERAIDCGLGLLLCFLGFTTCGPILAQVPSPRVEDAKSQLLREIELKDGPSRLHRREDLEDRLLKVVPKNPTDLHTPVLLYEVESRSYHVVNGEVIETTCSDACTNRRFVGISWDGARVYRLLGFRGDHEDFARMAADSRVAIWSPEASEGYADFCSEIVFGISLDRWVLDDSIARTLAIKFYGEMRSLDKFDEFKDADRWWKRFKSLHPGFDFQIHAEPGKNGSYIVSIPVFQGSSAGPLIERLEIEVRRDGHCARTDRGVATAGESVDVDAEERK
ncbi:MAG: hypothetical protein ABSG25_05575 [Bryobacteraceae bacterium]